MKELALKYGCNPNQKPSRIYMEEGELPIEVINGHYKLVNSKGVRITRRYDNMPEWANEILLIRYKKETSAWVNT